MAAYRNPDGGITVTDDQTGEVLFTIPGNQIQDSATQPTAPTGGAGSGLPGVVVDQAIEHGPDLFEAGSAASEVAAPAASAGAELLPGGATGAFSPTTPVASTVMADGSAGVVLADGSVVPAAASEGMFSLGGIGSAGNVILPVAGAAGIYDIVANGRGGGRGALQGAASGAAIGSYFGPPGALIGAGVGAIGGYFGDAFNQKSTIEYQDDKTQELAALGINPGYLEQRNKGIREREAGGGIAPIPEWQQGKITERGHLTEAGMNDPASLWGTSGMLETFGNDYLEKWSEQDRFAVTREAINQGLFDPEKGDWNITDPEKLRSLAEEAKKNEDYIAEYQAWKAGNPTPTATGSAEGQEGVEVVNAPTEAIPADLAAALKEYQVGQLSAQRSLRGVSRSREILQNPLLFQEDSLAQLSTPLARTNGLSPGSLLYNPLLQ